MSTKIIHTCYQSISEELKENILAYSFTIENLKNIKNDLKAANEDYEGEFSSLVNEIEKIFKYEREVEGYYEDGDEFYY